MAFGRSAGSGGATKPFSSAGGFHPGGAQSTIRARGGSITPVGDGGTAALSDGAVVGHGHGTDAGRSRVADDGTPAEATVVAGRGLSAGAVGATDVRDALAHASDAIAAMVPREARAISPMCGRMVMRESMRCPYPICNMVHTTEQPCAKYRVTTRMHRGVISRPSTTFSGPDDLGGAFERMRRSVVVLEHVMRVRELKYAHRRVPGRAASADEAGVAVPRWSATTGSAADGRRMPRRPPARGSPGGNRADDE